MKWIFALLAIVLIMGCIGEAVVTEAEDIAEISSEDYTQVDDLGESTMESEEELGSGIDEEELF